MIFVRFIWMVANTAATNSRLSQSLSNDSSSDHLSDSFAVLRGSFLSRMRVQIGAAIAKAAAARFVPDSSNEGDNLPLHIPWQRGNPAMAAPLPDLPLYHSPC